MKDDAMAPSMSPWLEHCATPRQPSGTIRLAMTFRKRGASDASAEGMSAERRSCLKFATESNEIYAKTALIELAMELRATARELERRRSTETNAAEPNDPA